MTAPAAARKNAYGARYYPVPNPQTGEVVELPAVSRILDVLNSPQLSTWKLKTVATQFSQRPDLVMLAASDPYGASKQALDSAQARSNIGTAVHSLSEQIDDGTLIRKMVSPPALKYVEQYEAAKAYFQWEVVAQEVTVFNHELGFAGTLDRILRFPEGLIVERGASIADLKTGAAVWPSQALQMMFYALGKGIWSPPSEDQLVEFNTATAELNANIAACTNIPEGRRKWSEDAVKVARAELDTLKWQEYASLGAFIEMPEDLQRKTAFILHLSDEKFELVPMNLEGAEDVVKGMCAIFHWQNKPASSIVGKAMTVPQPESAIAESLLEWVQNLRERANALPLDKKHQLRAEWPQGVPELKSGPFQADETGRAHLTAIDELLRTLEVVHQVETVFPGSEQVENEEKV
jgi:RecB family exonuclease